MEMIMEIQQRKYSCKL